jgi:hypothetical protein
MTILTALAAAYDRLAGEGRAPPYGYSTGTIHFLIALNPDGSVATVSALGDGKSGRPMFVPQAVKRSSGIAANFLWDKTSYVLGVALRAVPRPERCIKPGPEDLEIHRRGKLLQRVAPFGKLRRTLFDVPEPRCSPAMPASPAIGPGRWNHDSRERAPPVSGGVRVLKTAEIAIGMDGKGAWRDNVFVERLRRTVNCEEAGRRAYAGVALARAPIGRYLGFGNGKRPHSSPGGKTPDRAYAAVPTPIPAAA